MNYSNSTTYKTFLTRDGRANEQVETFVNLWRSTSAITRIDLVRDGTNQIKTETTITLYGIKAA